MDTVLLFYLNIQFACSYRTKDSSKHVKKLGRKSLGVTSFYVSFEILHKSLLFDRSRKVCTLLETSV